MDPGREKFLLQALPSLVMVKGEKLMESSQDLQ
jgi:hypothetical protein